MDREARLESGMPTSSSSSAAPEQLVLLTLNLQYFASYPADKVAAENRLREVLSKEPSPDVICVQEGLASRDVLKPVGYIKTVCAGAADPTKNTELCAQSVREMVYHDQPTLRACPPELHDELLCNEIYVRHDSSWRVVKSGIQKISSDLQLAGGGSRAQGKLAVRSMVWVKLYKQDCPVVYVMCTHITGGRFEDQYFVQQLAEERRKQPERILDFFDQRENPMADDLGILLGDYNATDRYDPEGPMHGYYKASIKSSEGVQADASAADLNEVALEDSFKEYMISPFQAIAKRNWFFAYSQDTVDFVTSGFGHLIDHMATNRRLEAKAEVVYMTNQKFKPHKDTDLPLTDHNSVKVVFQVTKTRHRMPWRLVAGCFTVLSGIVCLRNLLPSGGRGGEQAALLPAS